MQLVDLSECGFVKIVDAKRPCTNLVVVLRPKVSHALTLFVELCGWKVSVAPDLDKRQQLPVSHAAMIAKSCGRVVAQTGCNGMPIRRVCRMCSITIAFDGKDICYCKLMKGGTLYYYAGSQNTIIAFTEQADGVLLSLDRFDVQPPAQAGRTLISWPEFEDLARGVVEIQARRTRDMG